MTPIRLHRMLSKYFTDVVVISDTYQPDLKAWYFTVDVEDNNNEWFAFLSNFGSICAHGFARGFFNIKTTTNTTHRFTLMF